MKIKLGVIFGGESVEHEVSIISAVQAMESIDEEKYDIIPIYISKDRIWYTGPMLKEIDVYFDPYVKQYYLAADQTEKALFKELVDQEDPDLLDWFMEVSEPPKPELRQLIIKLKHYVHG